MAGPRSSVDAARLSNLVARPGIDPRVWIMRAVVLDVAFDAEHGMFADVQYMNGDKDTCLVGSGYAGNDYGTFVPPEINDIVLVAVPMGDPGEGPVMFARLWSGSERPPREFGDESTSEPTDATKDPTTVVRPGRTLRVVARDGANVRFEVSGSGKVEIRATGQATVEVHAESAVIIDSPDVRLGKTPGQPVARVGDLVAITLPPMVVPIVGTAGITPVISAAVPPLPTLQAVGQIVSGAGSVKS